MSDTDTDTDTNANANAHTNTNTNTNTHFGIVGRPVVSSSATLGYRTMTYIVTLTDDMLNKLIMAVPVVDWMMQSSPGAQNIPESDQYTMYTKSPQNISSTEKHHVKQALPLSHLRSRLLCLTLTDSTAM